MTHLHDPLEKGRRERATKAFDKRCRSLAGPVKITYTKENSNMATAFKTITTPDTNSGRGGKPKREVHYAKVGKTNRVKIAKEIGGTLVDHLGHPTGDFHIELQTKVNGKVKDLSLEKNDVVFRTGTSNRWQVITLKGFNRRFPLAKLR